MNTNEFEYYLIYGTNISNCPMVELDEDANGINYRWVTTPIEDCELVKMRFAAPYPKKPTMTDFHQDGIVSFFSKKIHDALQPITFEGAQLLRGEIKDPKNKKIYEDYYYLHIFNKISCLDRNLSKFDASTGSGMVLSISKMILDKDVLSNIPLQERLIFRLGEKSSFQLFHKSVVDAIMATNPEGIRFVKVEDYHMGAAFD